MIGTSKGGGGTLEVKSNLFLFCFCFVLFCFVLFCFALFCFFDVFVSFQITHLSELNKAFKSYNCKGIKKIISFSLLFSECFHLCIHT